MRIFILCFLLTASAAMFGQIGTDYHLSGPGYIYQLPCGDTPEASCGNIHTYEIVDEECSPMNLSTCSVAFKWQIRDAGTGNNYFLSHNGLGNWSQHFGAVMSLQTSNLKLTVYDISCTSITLKIEILDNSIAGDAQVFGLSASTSVGNIGVVDTDCEGSGIGEPNDTDPPSFDDCPSCKAAFAAIFANSPSPTENCGEFEINLPEGILDCYDVLFHNTETVTLNSYTYIFSYSANGSYTVGITLIDPETGKKCFSKRTLVVDCFEECPDCESIMDLISIEATSECGNYEIEVPNLPECLVLGYSIDNNYQGILSFGTTAVNFSGDGIHTISFQLIELGNIQNNCIEEFSFEVDCPCDESKINDTWVFGQNKWNFDDTASDGFVNTQISQYMKYATSSISDKTSGDLLFYTDGINIYANNDNIMSGGNELFGASSSDPILNEFYINSAFCNGPGLDLSTVILPKPGTENLYYVFYSFDLYAFKNDCMNGILNGQNFNYGLRYAEVDMAANGGLGAVLSKNNVISPSTVSGLTTALASDSQSYWLLAAINGDLYAYKVDGTGIDIANPVVTSTSNDIFGEVKVSPDWTYLVNDYIIYDFDNLSGAISSPNYILGGLPTGVVQGYKNSSHNKSIFEFSPDSKILYFISASNLICTSCNSLYDNSGLSMYNLQTNQLRGLITLTDYEYPLFGQSVYSANIQRASNGKIYFIFNQQEYTGVNNDFVDTDFGWTNPNPPFTFDPFDWGVMDNPNVWNPATHPITAIAAPSGSKNGYVFPQLVPTVPCEDEIQSKGANITTRRSNSDDLVVFPNPARDIINLSFKNNLNPEFGLTIINNLGVVFHRSNNKTEINVNDLPSGLYYIKVMTNDGLIYVKPVIVE